MSRLLRTLDRAKSIAYSTATAAGRAGLFVGLAVCGGIGSSWYLSTQQAAPAAPVDDDADAIGYEAAHPTVQSRHWPEAQRSSFADLS